MRDMTRQSAAGQKAKVVRCGGIRCSRDNNRRDNSTGQTAKEAATGGAEADAAAAASTEGAAAAAEVAAAAEAAGKVLDERGPS